MLFDWQARIAPARTRAWDCATDSGQASIDLAEHFDRIIATDASQAQIKGAMAHPRVAYRVATAQTSGLSDRSVDLITVAQALHCFDLAAFYTEVRRVLKPTGVLAVWTSGVYSAADIGIDTAAWHFYTDIFGPYWPPERAQVESGYRDLPFPIAEIAPPAFAMTADRSLPQLLGYLRSWSATGRYIQDNGVDPVIELAERLVPQWGPADTAHTLTWPLALRVGRVNE